MSVAFIQNPTNKKLKHREPWLAQENNYNIIDISLCAGQMIIPGKDDKLFSEFFESLDFFNQQLSALFPFITFAEKNYLHSTLLTIFNDSVLEFKKNKPDLNILCQRIIKDFNAYRPLTIYFKNVVLTPNGSVILLGESQELFKFRDDIYNRYSIPKDLRKNIIHITLGRLLQNELIENMDDINSFLQMKGSISLPPVTINYPKIILSRDSLCLDVDSNLTNEFNSAT